MKWCITPSTAWPVSDTAVSTNTLSPQTIGEPEPRPGIGTFQRTLLVSLQVAGGSASGATPVASGPRHCGQ